VTRFQEISIKGFRRLAECGSNCARSLCRSGNGIGKTSLLDVIYTVLDAEAKRRAL
jgi:predicted ATPase